MYPKVSVYYSDKADSDWIEPLVEQYYDKIYTYCYRILRNVHDAEDATQEVFINAIKNEKITKAENQNAWLYKVAYHHCMNKIKRKKLLTFIPFMEKKNLQVVYESHEEGTLQYILEQLKPEERALIVLRIVENYSFEEISVIFDISVVATRKRFERVKSKIKKQIERWEQYE